MQVKYRHKDQEKLLGMFVVTPTSDYYTPIGHLEACMGEGIYLVDMFSFAEGRYTYKQLMRIEGMLTHALFFNTLDECKKYIGIPDALECVG